VSVDKIVMVLSERRYYCQIFMKCDISNTLDGSEDHLIYEDDKEEEEKKTKVRKTIFRDYKFSSVL
jgi:hypothetical protein